MRKQKHAVRLQKGARSPQPAALVAESLLPLAEKLTAIKMLLAADEQLAAAFEAEYAAAAASSAGPTQSPAAIAAAHVTAFREAVRKHEDDQNDRLGRRIREAKVSITITGEDAFVIQNMAKWADFSADDLAGVWIASGVNSAVEDYSNLLADARDATDRASLRRARALLMEESEVTA